MDYIYKIAEEPWEYEAIHRLNHAAFAEEIPQHQRREDGRLVDFLHEENTYIICIREGELIGMLCVRAQRPFSLDRKVEDLDRYFPRSAKHICEIRLFTIRKEFRGGTVIKGLFRAMIRYCLVQGYDCALITGTLRQQKLYRHMGFVPFAHTVGSGEALFQPMYLTVEVARIAMGMLMPGEDGEKGGHVYA